MSFIYPNYFQIFEAHSSIDNKLKKYNHYSIKHTNNTSKLFNSQIAEMKITNSRSQIKNLNGRLDPNNPSSKVRYIRYTQYPCFPVAAFQKTQLLNQQYEIQSYKTFKPKPVVKINAMQVRKIAEKGQRINPQDYASSKSRLITGDNSISLSCSSTSKTKLSSNNRNIPSTEVKKRIINGCLDGLNQSPFRLDNYGLYRRPVKNDISISNKYGTVLKVNEKVNNSCSTLYQKYLIHSGSAKKDMLKNPYKVNNVNAPNKDFENRSKFNCKTEGNIINISSGRLENKEYKEYKGTIQTNNTSNTTNNFYTNNNRPIYFRDYLIKESPSCFNKSLDKSKSVKDTSQLKHNKNSIIIIDKELSVSKEKVRDDKSFNVNATLNRDISSKCTDISPDNNDIGNIVISNQWEYFNKRQIKAANKTNKNLNHPISNQINLYSNSPYIYTPYPYPLANSSYRTNVPFRSQQCFQLEILNYKDNKNNQNNKNKANNKENNKETVIITLDKSKSKDKSECGCVINYDAYNNKSNKKVNDNSKLNVTNNITLCKNSTNANPNTSNINKDLLSKYINSPLLEVVEIEPRRQTAFSVVDKKIRKHRDIDLVNSISIISKKRYNQIESSNGIEFVQRRNNGCSVNVSKSGNNIGASNVFNKNKSKILDNYLQNPKIINTNDSYNFFSNRYNTYEGKSSNFDAVSKLKNVILNKFKKQNFAYFIKSLYYFSKLNSLIKVLLKNRHKTLKIAFDSLKLNALKLRFFDEFRQKYNIKTDRNEPKNATQPNKITKQYVNTSINCINRKNNVVFTSKDLSNNNSKRDINRSRNNNINNSNNNNNNNDSNNNNSSNNNNVVKKVYNNYKGSDELN